MSIKILSLTRKSFPAEGVQVTKENIVEVTDWCSGELKFRDNGVGYIKVEVFNPLSERQTEAAIGDWVIKVGTGFKVFTPTSFNRSFEIDGLREVSPDVKLEGLAL